MSTIKPTAEQVDLVEHAAAIIDGEAMCLRVAHTIGPDHTDWGSDVEAKATYDDFQRVVQRLYAYADTLRAAAGMPPWKAEKFALNPPSVTQGGGA